MTWVILRRVALGLATLFLSIAALTMLFIEFYEKPDSLPSGAIIVVLGAGQTHDGNMGRATAERLWTGIELFHALGDARMVVTGGILVDETRAVATAMAEAALLADVPENRLLVEPKALSTLQNALFTAGLLGAETSAPIILVTHRFHLPRAWASFRWAGMQDLTLYPVDTPNDHWLRFGAGIVFTESAKSVLNAGRAAVASVADLLGLDQDTYIRLLD